MLPITSTLERGRHYLKTSADENKEVHLRLRVDVSSSFGQDLHNFILTSQRGYVKGRVPFLDEQEIGSDER